MIGKSDSNFGEWSETVERWKVKYGSSVQLRTFNPTSIMVVKRCCKCSSVRAKMSRHHKGHEYLFAVLMEERYAARYIQFHPDDVDWLCNRCHVRAHVIYQKVLKEVYDYVYLCQDTGKPLQYEVLESFRQRLIKTYLKWVAYKKKRKRRRKKGNTNARSSGK